MSARVFNHRRAKYSNTFLFLFLFFSLLFCLLALSVRIVVGLSVKADDNMMMMKLRRVRPAQSIYPMCAHLKNVQSST